MTQEYKPLVGTDTFADSYTTLNNSDQALKTLFAGPVAPVDPEKHQPWLDTTAALLKIRNDSNTDWITVGKFATDFGMVSKDGAVMTSDGTGINMNGAPLTGLPQGEDSDAAARMADVSGKADTDSPEFTTNARCIYDALPPDNESLTTKQFTDTTYLKKSGDTVADQLIFTNAADDPQHAVRKNEFDIRFAPTGHVHNGTTDSGPKILGTNIDSTGAANDTVLTANGSGLTSWSNPQARFELLAEPVQILTWRAPSIVFVGGDWATQALTGLPEHCKYAYMQLSFQFAGTSGLVKLNVAVRLNGSSTTIPNALRFYGDSPGAENLNESDYTAFFWAPLGTVSGGEASFDWGVQAAGSSTTTFHNHGSSRMGLWMIGSA